MKDVKGSLSGYSVLGQCCRVWKAGSVRDQIDRKHETGMVDVNCKSLVYMTSLCLPYLAEGGRILQFASAAAFVPQPGFAVYAASKAFVLSYSRALNKELRPRRIAVTAVCPGPVKTEFFQVMEEEGGKSHIPFINAFLWQNRKSRKKSHRRQRFGKGHFCIRNWDERIGADVQGASSTMDPVFDGSSKERRVEDETNSERLLWISGDSEKDAEPGTYNRSCHDYRTASGQKFYR